MEKLKQKIAMRLTQKIGQELGIENIMLAMKDKDVQEQIKELVTLGKIQIVDQQENVVFEKEIFEELGIQRQASHVVTKKERSSAKKAKLGSSSQKDDSEKLSNFESDLNEVGSPEGEQIGETVLTTDLVSCKIY